MPAEVRLMRALLELSQEGQGSGTVALSHEDLGHIVGARRPTVSKALRVLAGMGLIETAHLNIRIPDRAALRSAAEVSHDRAARL